MHTNTYSRQFTLWHAIRYASRYRLKMPRISFVTVWSHPSFPCLFDDQSFSIRRYGIDGAFRLAVAHKPATGLNSDVALYAIGADPRKQWTGDRSERGTAGTPG